MPNIMLVMHRKAIAQGLMAKLQKNADIKLIYEPNYDKAQINIDSNNAKVALIEASESGPYNMGYCLILCNEIRKNTPDCKLLLMCSEQDEKSVKLVIEAKGKKKIDDFVFYDVTIDYLASKLMSI
ncbi:MAG: hypothetical protein GX808_00500 [Syntrophomonadaceae bacterium]|nr:hypothetical protein [Syntrophomonadaceae bacterium]